MKPEIEEEKKFWLKNDRDNKIYQSNRAFAFGGFLILLFTYKYVNLCLNYSSFEEFKVAVRTTEKLISILYVVAVFVGILFIILGIKIRKSPLSEQPRDLP